MVPKGVVELRRRWEAGEMGQRESHGDLYVVTAEAVAASARLPQARPRGRQLHRHQRAEFARPALYVLVG